MKNILVLFFALLLGCSSCKKEPFKDCCKETYRMVIDDTIVIVTPNAFTPDDNNINDVTAPIGGHYQNYSYLFTVSDNDNVLYQSSNFAYFWEGNGKSGPFSFSLNVKNLVTGEEHKQEGTICAFTKGCIEKGYLAGCQFNDGYDWDLAYRPGYNGEVECQ